MKIVKSNKMKKVIKIFLRNKIIEIKDGLLFFFKVLGVVVGALAILTTILGTIGYFITLLLGKYSWYWEAIGASSTKDIFEMGAHGMIFLMFSIIVLLMGGTVVYIILWIAPKEFINWIKFNWEKAKIEAKNK